MHRTPAATAIAALAVAPLASAAVDDFATWTEIQDPPDPGLTASVSPDGSEATLIAVAPPLINSGTDIGYASVNGNTVAEANAGYFFDSDNSFEIAIDFDLTWANADGGIVIGLGIGEDAAGVNSAGPVFAAGTADFTTGGGTSNIGFTAIGAAARNNDDTVVETLLTADGSSSNSGTADGRFFVAYDATTGDISAGFSNTPGANDPDEEVIITALELDEWTGTDLLASFFVSSRSVTETLNVFGIPTTVTIDPWTAGTATAIFSNFEVLEDNAIAVPEPATAALLALGLGLITTRRRA